MYVELWKQEAMLSSLTKLPYPIKLCEATPYKSCLLSPITFGSGC